MSESPGNPVPELRDARVGRAARPSRPSPDARRTYTERRARHIADRDRAEARSRRLSHLRTAAFLLALAPVVVPGTGVLLAMRVALAVLAFVAFLALVVVHSRAREEVRWHDTLRALSEEGLARLDRDWDRLPSIPGPADAAAFAADLDVFGHASLTRILGPVATTPGGTALVRWLLGPAGASTIRERQAAMIELARRYDLRERLAARGRLAAPAAGGGRGRDRQVKRFLTWAEGRPWLRERPWLLWTGRISPLVAAALMALNAAGLVGYRTWLALLTVNLALTFTIGREIQRIFDRAFARESEVQSYSALFRILSEAEFEAPALRWIHGVLTVGGVAAHQHMARLHRLLDRAELRHSMFYLPIQAFTLWDIHVLAQLERWQTTAGTRVRRWLEAFGEAEALTALATLHHDQPDWAIPEVVEAGPPRLEAEGLGHPLLRDETRVPNDVELGPPGTFLFVTGSNMSGKSTLLRAIGLNAVLAQAGAPVCATRFRLSPLRIATSMRIHDSLERGLSHYMAELQRLKAVVEAARRATARGDCALLYLLDDVLQGTNTAERRVAVRRILQHLLGQHAIGALTTHDLALADAPQLSEAARPAHFAETIESGPDGPKISFDYRLRPGVATSTNALKLLEIVGLGGHDSPDRIG